MVKKEKKNLQISQFFYHLNYKSDFLTESFLFVFHLEIKVYHPVAWVSELTYLGSHSLCTVPLKLIEAVT